jgi:hypothetical protein
MAAETRIVVLDPSPNLLDAVSVALSPWGSRVVPITAPIPATDVATATVTARALASEQSADAVLWIEAPPGLPASLWLYDAQTAQMTVRPLSQAPPFDDASAAAVALTVKTLLRTTTVAPPKERTGAPAASSSSSPSPSAGAAPPEPAPASPAHTEDAPAPPRSLLAPPAPAPPLRLEAFAFAHLPIGTGAPVAPRVGLGVSSWPGRWHERIGFGLDLRAGTSPGIATSTFAGSFSETVVGLSARTRLGGDRLSVELATGPSLHVTSLTGVEIATGTPSSILRGDPGLEVAAIPQLALGARLRLGLFLGASFLLRTQRYSLDADLVFRLPAVGLDLGGRASLALD